MGMERALAGKEARRGAHGWSSADRRRKAAETVGRHPNTQTVGVKRFGELRPHQVGHADPGDPSGQPGQQPPEGECMVAGMPRPRVGRPDG